VYPSTRTLPIQQQVKGAKILPSLYTAAQQKATNHVPRAIMSQDYSVLSALRSLVIFTAFACVFYFLVVWNPVGTLGDVRNYLEHRVRVPVEWIVAAFVVAWLLQRKLGYAVAAAFLVPLFVLILTLTRPDYGAEFWRIFRHEIYLDPTYVPRGLLVCFFLLSLMAYPRKDLDKARAFLLCLIIGFALTSWEALITPVPPHTSEGGDWFVGPWMEAMHAGWGIISQYISQYIPLDYQNAARIGVSVYPFLAFFLLLFPGYRRLPQDFIRKHREEFPIYLFMGVLLGLSGWAFSAANGSAVSGTKALLWLLSLPAVLAWIVLILTSIVWVPAGLFLLPTYLFWVGSLPFKVAYALVVKAPFMAWHYLHYLTVPHPLEKVIKKYEKVRLRRGIRIDHAAFGEEMERARYDHEREGIPAWWKSKNWERRLKDILGLRGRVKAETDVADAYTEEIRARNRQQR
jgi:hypothetical protein